MPVDQKLYEVSMTLIREGEKDATDEFMLLMETNDDDQPVRKIFNAVVDKHTSHASDNSRVSGSFISVIDGKVLHFLLALHVYA